MPEVLWDLLDCISHNDPLGLAGPLNGCWEAFQYDNKVRLLVAWSSGIQHSIMLCTPTKSLVCPALEGPSVRGWWKKIKDGWSSYLEERKEAGEKGRMVSVWSRDTPRQFIYFDTFDEARFRDMSVSLSIWSDLVSMRLVRVSVFLPDLDNSSLSVSSYSSYGGHAIDLDACNLWRYKAKTLNNKTFYHSTGEHGVLVICCIVELICPCFRLADSVLCLPLPSAYHQTKFYYILIARSGLRPYLFSNTTFVIWRNNTFSSHDPLAYLH